MTLGRRESMNWLPAELFAGRPRNLVRTFAVGIYNRYRGCG